MNVLDIKVSNWKGHEQILKIDTDPDSCPICHRAIEPIDMKKDFLADQSKPAFIERLFRCPKKDCQRLFIARYAQYPPAPNVYLLKNCVPAELLGPEFPEGLRKILPDYCDIYAQAYKAEQLGMLLVAGPGYRKSLEFLIKDYVSLLHPEAEEEIEHMPLAGCIKKYVADTRVKVTAERAAWLGNDETHYVRRWQDKDLQDLKRFIQLASFWMQSEQLTNNAVIDMPERQT